MRPPSRVYACDLASNDRHSKPVYERECDVASDMVPYLRQASRCVDDATLLINDTVPYFRSARVRRLASLGALQSPFDRVSHHPTRERFHLISYVI